MLPPLLLPARPSRVLMNHARSFVDLVPYFLTVRVGRDGFFSFLRAQVPAVTVNFVFRPVQQLTRLRYIAHVPGCDFYMMDQPRVTVCPNMRLVAEVPVLTFLALVRFRITLLFLILRRWRCRDQRRIHDRPLHQDQTVLLQRLYKVGKQLFLQSVLRQDITKSPDGIPIRYLVARLYTAEPRKRAAVYDFIPCGHIRQVLQNLQHMYPYHQFQVVGLVAALSFIVVRLDYAYPIAPRHQPVHLL